jgi:hypothetical protein
MYSESCIGHDDLFGGLRLTSLNPLVLKKRNMIGVCATH